MSCRRSSIELIVSEKYAVTVFRTCKIKDNYRKGIDIKMSSIGNIPYDTDRYQIWILLLLAPNPTAQCD